MVELVELVELGASNMVGIPEAVGEGYHSTVDG